MSQVLFVNKNAIGGELDRVVVQVHDVDDVSRELVQQIEDRRWVLAVGDTIEIREVK